MNTKRLTVCVMACAALSLGGCAGLSSGSSSDLLKQLDSNFATCDRHITFQAGVGVAIPGAQVSGSVDCKGNAAPVPVGPPPAVGVS
jgi:hypothetical protein